MLVLGATFSSSVSHAQAAAPATCAPGDYHLTVAADASIADAIEQDHGVKHMLLNAHKRVATHKTIDGNTLVCISDQRTQTKKPRPAASQQMVKPVVTSVPAVTPTPRSVPALSQPTATPVPPSGSSVESIITQVFGANAPAAIQVARCESGLNPGAYNPASIGGSHAAGLFQILYPSTWSGTSQAASSPYNAWANATAAHDIFVRDGYSWREWQCLP